VVSLFFDPALYKLLGVSFQVFVKMKPVVSIIERLYEFIKVFAMIDVAPAYYPVFVSAKRAFTSRMHSFYVLHSERSWLIGIKCLVNVNNGLANCLLQHNGGGAVNAAEDNLVAVAAEPSSQVVGCGSVC